MSFWPRPLLLFFKDSCMDFPVIRGMFLSVFSFQEKVEMKFSLHSHGRIFTMCLISPHRFIHIIGVSTKTHWNTKRARSKHARANGHITMREQQLSKINKYLCWFNYLSNENELRFLSFCSFSLRIFDFSSRWNESRYSLWFQAVFSSAFSVLCSNISFSPTSGGKSWIKVKLLLLLSFASLPPPLISSSNTKEEKKQEKAEMAWKIQQEKRRKKSQ